MGNKMERKRGESGADPAPEAEQQAGQSGFGTPAQVASPGRPVVRPQDDGTFLVVGYRDTRTTLPHPGPGKPVQIKARGLDPDLDTTGNTSGAGRVLSVVKRGELQPAPPRRATKPRARKPPKPAKRRGTRCYGCGGIATSLYRVDGEDLAACELHGMELVVSGAVSANARRRLIQRREVAKSRHKGIGAIWTARVQHKPARAWQGVPMAERARIEREKLAEEREAKRRGAQAP